MSNGDDTTPKKDFWDILSAIGPLVAGLIVSGIGAVFTYNYNQRQIEIQEVQTVEKFFPHLLSDNQESKELAILAISSLGNTKLATELAVRYPSTGTTAALQSISNGGVEKDRDLANEALSSLNRKLVSLTEEMFSDQKQTRIIATTELVRKWKSNPQIVEASLRTAEQHLNHLSGTINTLVVLENVDMVILQEYQEEVDAYLREVESRGAGPQTLEHIRLVRYRLNTGNLP
jgi:hypothetical protein